MADNQLVTLSKVFAISTINLCEKMKVRGKAAAVIDQMMRSGTSIGANIHEANYASSKADFINKLKIALKECYETEYWLELMQKAELITMDAASPLLRDCGTLRRMLISSINTAKQNQGKEQ